MVVSFTNVLILVYFIRLVVFFLSLACLQTRAHEYGFRHFTAMSAFDFASGYVVFQSSAEVDYAPCDSDDRWYYFFFESGFVHDVPTFLIKTCKPDASGSVITGCTLPSIREVLRVVLAKRRVTCNEVVMLMRIEAYYHLDVVLHLSNDMEDLLAVDHDAEATSDLQTSRLLVRLTSRPVWVAIFQRPKRNIFCTG